MSGTEVVVEESAMKWDLQQDCIDCAAHAFKHLRLNDQTAIAQFIKQELDEKYGARWHCIVGHSYAAFVGHDSEYFIYFRIDNLYFTIWRIDTEYEEIQVPVAALIASQEAKRNAAPDY